MGVRSIHSLVRSYKSRVTLWKSFLELLFCGAEVNAGLSLSCFKTGKSLGAKEGKIREDWDSKGEVKLL